MLGPSGCGKTTTLRMIGGFELPTAGRIELRGRDVTTDPPDKRPVNMVFQNYALFPHLDVARNIAFGLRRKSVDKAEIERRVGEALDLVHLAGYDKRKPNQLSGGQQQRVALARALVNRPQVLLLDEPLGALDLKLRKALQIELKRVQSEVGITFVYVTHDQEEALTMSDRIAVMRGGKVEQLGTPEELYDRPADALRRRLHRHVEPDGRHRRDGRRRRRAVVRLDSGDVLRRRPRPTGRRPGDRAAASGRSRSRSGRERGRPLERAGTDPGAVEQVAYLGGPSSTSSARRAVSRSRSWRRRAGSGSRSAAPSTSPGRPATRSSSPSHPRRRRSRHDRPVHEAQRRRSRTDELELAFLRALAERRISRRQLLEVAARVGPRGRDRPDPRCLRRFGDPAAVGGGAVAWHRRRSAPSTAASAAPTVEPTPVGSPEGELNVYNWDAYIGEDTVAKFTEADRDQGPLRQVRHRRDDAREDPQRRQGRGLRHLLPDLRGRSGPRQRRRRPAAHRRLIPNATNLGAQWQNPGYDPGNQHSMPYMWWTTGFCWDGDKIKDDLTSWTSLWDPAYKGKLMMLDDIRETFAVAAFRLGLDPNTTNEGDLDKMLHCSRSRSPSSGPTRPPTSTTMISGRRSSATPGRATSTRCTTTSRTSST